METRDGEKNTLLGCRACLQITSAMFPLFEPYEPGISLASILELYVIEKFNAEANLPNRLCKECSVTLVKFHNFMVIYRETQNKLNKLRKTGNEHTNPSNKTHIPETVIIKPEIDANNFEYLDEDNEDGETNKSVAVKEELEEENPTNISTQDHNEGNSSYKEKTEDVTQYDCPFCNDIFLYMDLLNRHISNNHKFEAIKFDGVPNMRIQKRRTYTDDSVTNANYNFNVNLVDKTFNNKHTCKLCGKSFPSVKSLNSHEGFHKNVKNSTDKDLAVEKQFVCDVCGRSFKKKSYLTSHAERHDTVRRQYKCVICHKHFKGRANFARHRRSHNEPKRQHVCEVCGMAFNLRGTLTTHHFLKHVRERNYQCLICAQFFNLKSTLEKHVRRHQRREGTTQPVKYPCDFCGMQYLDKSSLKRHVETKHCIVNQT